MNDTRNQATTSKNTLWRVLVSVAIALTSSLVVIFYGHRIYDHFAAQAFTPSSQIAAIHDNLKLTKQGSDILYASQPKLEDGQAFNNSCQSAERTAAILGCYYMRRVYVYDVTNNELAEAEEVTTAHEMLHAAYERLNAFDRNRIDELIDAEYNRLQGDSKVQQLMEYYKKAEPSALTNELHSILGTVVADLSPELEDYYARYFTDRQHVVDVNNSYYAVFAEVEAEAKELTAKIDALDKQVKADKNNYQAAVDQLKLDIQAYKSRKYTSNSLAQADARALNVRVASLESMRQAINTKVGELNGLIKQQNDLSVRANELNSSINGIVDAEVSL